MLNQRQRSEASSRRIRHIAQADTAQQTEAEAMLKRVLDEQMDQQAEEFAFALALEHRRLLA